MAEPSQEQQRVARARADLAAVLDALDDKFNVPKRAQAAAARVRASVRRNPWPWIAGAVGAVALIAGIAWVARKR